MWLLSTLTEVDPVLLVRLIAWMFLPISICLELLTIGLLLLWFGKRMKLGKVLVTIGTLLLFLFSFGPFGNVLVRPLESEYPSFPDSPQSAENGGGEVQWVVVLGAGYNPDPVLPISARLSSEGLVRLVEGIRIRRGLTGAKLLILIGGAGEGDGRVQTTADLAVALGVPGSDVIVDAGASHTVAEVEVIRRTVGDSRFVLVTSAFHLPRAVRACNDRGMWPIPAPTAHKVRVGEYPLLHALPSAGNVGSAEMGFSERLARIWQFIRRE